MHFCTSLDFLYCRTYIILDLYSFADDYFSKWDFTGHIVHTVILDVLGQKQIYNFMDFLGVEEKVIVSDS